MPIQDDMLLLLLPPPMMRQIYEKRHCARALSNIAIMLPGSESY
jgi:hypothetical protein